ncbi:MULTISPECIES: hypothetical protein [Halococcus]|nr:MULTISPECIES: hypothetical protein [Halococcus]
MNSRGRRHLLFFAGIVALTTAVVVGLAAFRYEFVLREVVASPPPSGHFAVYADFPPAEQRLIEGAIDGNRYVFQGQAKLPKTPTIPYTGQLTVRYDGQSYLFNRRMFFAAGTRAGVATIALVVGGLLSVAIAVRRDMRVRR